MSDQISKETLDPLYTKGELELLCIKFHDSPPHVFIDPNTLVDNIVHNYNNALSTNMNSEQYCFYWVIMLKLFTTTLKEIPMMFYLLGEGDIEVSPEIFRYIPKSVKKDFRKVIEWRLEIGK